MIKYWRYSEEPHTKFHSIDSVQWWDWSLTIAMYSGKGYEEGEMKLWGSQEEWVTKRDS